MNMACKFMTLEAHVCIQSLNTHMVTSVTWTERTNSELPKRLLHNYVVGYCVFVVVV